MPEGLSIPVLHSGGLDSCLGLIEASERANVFATSVVTHDRPGKVQRDVISNLRDGTLHEITWAPIYIGLSGVPRSAQESSQRSRAFLYLVAGAVASVLAETYELQVCENGVGSINLPYSRGQLGVDNTRAMHPLTLGRFSRLSSRLMGFGVNIRNIGLWKTKRELCEEFLVREGGEQKSGSTYHLL